MQLALSFNGSVNGVNKIFFLSIIAIVVYFMIDFYKNQKDMRSDDGIKEIVELDDNEFIELDNGENDTLDIDAGLYPHDAIHKYLDTRPNMNYNAYEPFSDTGEQPHPVCNHASPNPVQMIDPSLPQGGPEPEGVCSDYTKENDSNFDAKQSIHDPILINTMVSRSACASNDFNTQGVPTMPAPVSSDCTNAKISRGHTPQCANGACQVHTVSSDTGRFAA